MDAEAEHEVPPAAAMMGLITGYWVSQAVGVVALLGVADQLGQGPRGSDELARAVGADPQTLYRVLRLLASLGVFTEAAPGSFTLTPLGETLRSDAPDSVRNFAITETAPWHWLPWGRLHESVRSGRPMAREALGMELFDWYAQNPEEAGFFNAAMGNLSALAASELVRVYDFSSVRTVADVGGAHGVLLTAVLRDNPAAHGILFDLPHVIATAGDAIAAAGLQERCQLVSGDFFEQCDRGRTRSPCSSPDQIARHIRDPADAQPTVR
jgi:O-methyltransferase domain